MNIITQVSKRQQKDSSPDPLESDPLETDPLECDPFKSGDLSPSYHTPTNLTQGMLKYSSF